MLNVNELLDRLTVASHTDQPGSDEVSRLAWRPYVTKERGRGLLLWMPVVRRPWAGVFAGKCWLPIRLQMDASAADEEDRIDAALRTHTMARCLAASDLTNRFTIWGATVAVFALFVCLLTATFLLAPGDPTRCDQAAHLLSGTDAVPADASP